MTGERSSSVYQSHKSICEEYESIMEELGANVKGYYSCYSYNVLAEFNTKYKWQMRLRKFSYHNFDSFLEQPAKKYYDLLNTSQWSTNHFFQNSPPFFIRKENKWDLFRLKFNRNWNRLPGNKGYIIKSQQPQNPTVAKINDILSQLYFHGEVYEISYANSKLFIDIRTDRILRKEMRAILKL